MTNIMIGLVLGGTIVMLCEWYSRARGSEPLSQAKFIIDAKVKSIEQMWPEIEGTKTPQDFFLRKFPDANCFQTTTSWPGQPDRIGVWLVTKRWSESVSYASGDTEEQAWFNASNRLLIELYKETRQRTIVWNKLLHRSLEFVDQGSEDGDILANEIRTELDWRDRS